MLNTRDRTGINFQYLHKISVISFFYLKIYYWKALINIIWKTTDIYIYFLKILFVRINNMYKCTKIIAYPIIVYSSLIVSNPSSDTYQSEADQRWVTDNKYKGFFTRDRNLFSCKTKIQFLLGHDKSIIFFKCYQNFSMKIARSDYLFFCIFQVLI